MVISAARISRRYASTPWIACSAVAARTTGMMPIFITLMLLSVHHSPVMHAGLSISLTKQFRTSSEPSLKKQTPRVTVVAWQPGDAPNLPGNPENPLHVSRLWCITARWTAPRNSMPISRIFNIRLPAEFRPDKGDEFGMARRTRSTFFSVHDDTEIPPDAVSRSRCPRCQSRCRSGLPVVCDREEPLPRRNRQSAS